MKKILAGSWGWGAVLIGLHVAVVAEAGNFYKWTDENGVIHYGDHVPPQYSQQGRAEVNKYGMTVGVTNAAKTKEQIAADERKARIQAEEHRKAEEQMAKDRVLLTSYANEKDLEMGRDGKIAALEGMIRITKSNIAILQRSMADMTAQAAEKERSGQPVPDEVRRDITAAQNLIVKHEAYIETKRKEQAELRAQFDADLKRFRELKAMQGITTPEPPPQKDPLLPKNDKETQELAVKETEPVSAECKDPPGCEKAWSLAQLYVRAKADTRLQIVNNTHLVTSEPTQPNTIGLSVTRIPDSGGARLVLEVLCNNSPEGQKYCRTPQVQAVRNGFKAYVEGH
ncbi:putative DUF4124 domain-containing protein [Gammaproteobacteria bacterium]